ncbi:uncharacterized protein MYCGRDRAFT_109048 [Zymoseptoria tritici IPO323]|uniref:Uncharacterized protein n=1 Tax=Zymoseptoria tritici (strain CBS 115943 / IPO323) TaxID=336722 RepID=F9X8X4_ZYMTI|nr:uncharacterized protein MYCGRDRAFT_109048 [Zymoseptoria tritici IPO323]EGP87913.1 hypothetical protein MYCGRDRAFT_109048 [Zymoseptoria tritici IPO323]
MSQSNVWTQRSKPSSASASRTPQNRSSTASPIQPETSRQENSGSNGSRPSVNNAWGQRGTGGGEAHSSSGSGFNANEVKAFLSREPAPEAYAGAKTSGAAAWGSKANAMANGQPFLGQLAKQIAAVEGGG